MVGIGIVGIVSGIVDIEYSDDSGNSDEWYQGGGGGGGGALTAKSKRLKPSPWGPFTSSTSDRSDSHEVEPGTGDSMPTLESDSFCASESGLRISKFELAP